MIGGQHGHHRVGVVPTHQHRGEANTWGRITLARLADERRGGQLRHLLGDLRDEPLIGDDQRLRRRDEVAQPIDGLTQHRLLADQGEQLLGMIDATGGPEPSSGPAGHDDGVEHRGK